MTIVKWENPTFWYPSGVHGTKIDATHTLFSEEAQFVLYWYLSGVHGTEIDATHTLFSEEAQFVSSQRIRKLSESSILLHNMPLHDFKVGIWCVMRANAITGKVLLTETTIHTSLLHTFWHHFLNTSTVQKYSMDSSESVFDDRIINIGLWPHSPNLKPCNQFFTCGAC